MNSGREPGLTGRGAGPPRTGGRGATDVGAGLICTGDSSTGADRRPSAGASGPAERGGDDIRPALFPARRLSAPRRARRLLVERRPSNRATGRASRSGGARTRSGSGPTYTESLARSRAASEAPPLNNAIDTRPVAAPASATTTTARRHQPPPSARGDATASWPPRPRLPLEPPGRAKIEPSAGETALTAPGATASKTLR